MHLCRTLSQLRRQPPQFFERLSVSATYCISLRLEDPSVRRSDSASHSGSILWPPRPEDGSSRKMDLNRIELIGFVGNDAESKTTSNGNAVATLSLATKTSFLKGC